MADYFVSAVGDDGGAGTIGDPWESINFACNNPIVNPGDTINVRAGTYVEHVFVNNTNSGTSGNPIKLIAYDGNNTVTIDGNYTFPTGAGQEGSGVDCVVTNTTDNPLSDTNGAPAGQFRGRDWVFNGLLMFQDVDHWEVRGFNIVNSRGRGISNNRTTGISYYHCHVDGARNAMFWTNGVDTLAEDCEFEDGGNYFPYSRSVQCANWPVGVNMIGAINTTIRRCKIHEHWGEGVGTGRDSANCIIEDCIIWDNMALDVYMHFSEIARCRRNIIFRTTTNKYNRGDNVPSCLVINMESQNFSSAPADDFIVENNVILGRNNYSLDIWNNQGGGATSGLIRIRNNSIINTGGVRGFPLHSITNGSTHSDTRVSNNYFWNTSGGNIFDGSTITSNFTWRNNMVSNNDMPSSMQGSNYIVDTPILAGGVPANPTPATAGDITYSEFYQLANSPTVNAGSSIDATSNDMIGTLRPQQNSYDIGAHEFNNQSGNIPPTVTVTNRFNDVDDTVAYVPVHNDLDGDTLTWSASSLPTGLSINSSTGAITGTPTTPGVYNYSVTVNDGNNPDVTDSAVWTISGVMRCICLTSVGGDINIAPVIEDIDNVTVNQGQNVLIDVEAFDANEDTLTYSATGIPTGISINSGTGVISGSTQLVGTHTITVTVNDGNGGTDSTSFDLTVNQVSAQNMWYVDGQQVSNGNGSQASPWNSLANINWTAIDGSSDKELFIVGNQTYTDRLIPQGTVEKITVINGPAIIQGPRTTLLPQAGETGHTAESNTGQNGISLSGAQDGLIIDGGTWDGLVVKGWLTDGIDFGDVNNVTLRNIEITNNGYITNRTSWDTNRGTCSGTISIHNDGMSRSYPNGSGIRLQGNGHILEYLNIHDNGADSIQSDHLAVGLNNITVRYSMLYNGRPNTQAYGSGGAYFGPNTESANYASHTDSVQLYSGGDVSGWLFENVLMMNMSNSLILGQTLAGSNQSKVDNVTIRNCLIINSADNAILSYPGIQNNNWTIEDTTIYGDLTKNNHIVGDAGSTGWNINGTVITGGGQAPLDCAAINFFGMTVPSGNNNFAHSNVNMGTGASTVFTQQNITFIDPVVDFFDTGFDLTNNTGYGGPSTIASLLGVTAASTTFDANGKITITP